MPGHATRQRVVTLEGVPVPSKRVKDDLAADLDHHASIAWPGLEEVTVRWRGGFGYVTAYISEDEGVPLCRGTSGSMTPGSSRSTTRPPTPTGTQSYLMANPPAALRTPWTAPAESTSPTYQTSPLTRTDPTITKTANRVKRSPLNVLANPSRIYAGLH
jgi:hypothetical protein